jgi:outer membrane lipoprotein SlyB
MNRMCSLISMAMALFMFQACSQQTARQAGQAGATGAVVGAVGGLVTGLVFGGNAAEAMARGAVYGGSTGAAAGAMAGAMAESNRKASQTEELKALRARLGEDAYQGLEALVQCKHDVAQAYGRTAAGSPNKNYALAGLWLQAIAFADGGEEDKARDLYPELIAGDDRIADNAQAENKMRGALQKLMDIREQYKLDRVCP